MCRPNSVYHKNWWFFEFHSQVLSLQVLCKISPLVWPNSGFWCCVFLTWWIRILSLLDQVQAKFLCPCFIPMHILFTMGRANKGKTRTCIHKSITIPKSICFKGPLPFYMPLSKSLLAYAGIFHVTLFKALIQSTSNCLWLTLSLSISLQFALLLINMTPAFLIVQVTFQGSPRKCLLGRIGLQVTSP